MCGLTSVKIHCTSAPAATCQVSVFERMPNQRDDILINAEVAEGKKMQICVLRSNTTRLVIDL